MKSMLRMLAIVCACQAAGAAPLPEATPESQGFMAERLQRLGDHMAAATARGDCLGAVVLVMRHGRVVEFNAWGHRDLGRQQAMRRDAIFRIGAMTKAVTAVAVLALLEEGRLGLDDSVAAHLPEFAATAPALTIRQLLAQTAGFSTAVALEDAADLEQFARRLAQAPLAAPPGSRFRDDAAGMVVAGRLVEAVSGLRFDAFLHKRVFQPLGMADTGFAVPAAQRHRIVDIAAADDDGKLAPPPEQDEVPGQRRHAYLSGADGLYSTAADYARFAQMLLNGGQLDGVRVLGRKSVELMMQNHLSHLANPTWDARAAEGYGLGGAVLLDVARAARLGSTGAFGWTGALSTRFTIDPRERLVVVLMLQHLPREGQAPRPVAEAGNLVYQALAR